MLLTQSLRSVYIRRWILSSFDDFPLAIAGLSWIAQFHRRNYILTCEVYNGRPRKKGELS
jgi:hypothetical protein